MAITVERKKAHTCLLLSYQRQALDMILLPLLAEHLTALRTQLR